MRGAGFPLRVSGAARGAEPGWLAGIGGSLGGSGFSARVAEASRDGEPIPAKSLEARSFRGGCGTEARRLVSTREVARREQLPKPGAVPSRRGSSVPAKSPEGTASQRGSQDRAQTAGRYRQRRPARAVSEAGCSTAPERLVGTGGTARRSSLPARSAGPRQVSSPVPAGLPLDAVS